ncbi:hypothetical protein I545_1730 [Mycobacterium kansasii 662]|uniref:Uncharacterized protein n=2 Tax=Mycobacterium kansasii TaxID=1768 RepID=A0A1V3XJM2_MYCKA|nr:hypothetical protein I545_1730 [Mycobacterium kansasii 662]OOK79395.1 hypothetical protein BZL30_2684 [Mycobacterium kansasii]
MDGLPPDMPPATGTPPSASPYLTTPEHRGHDFADAPFGR